MAQRDRVNLTDLPLVALLVIVLAMGAVFVIWSVRLHGRLQAAAEERECRQHLSTIYQAIQRYRADHHGQYPDSLAPPPRVFRRQPPITSLAPRYLDPAVLLCPADETGGVKLGWNSRFSYIYGLQELISSVPSVRRRVQTDLLLKCGPKLRLLTCPSLHQAGPVGALTLHADGSIGRDLILPSDPELRSHELLWKLEAASRPTPSGRPATRGTMPKGAGGR